MPGVRGQFLTIDDQATIDNVGNAFWKPESQATLNALVAQYGFPLVGIFIAGGAGTETPDFILERHSFPTPTGGGDLANKVQIAVDGLLEAAYKSSVDAQDRYFWAATHVWNYKPTKDYAPRVGGVGDYNLYLSNTTPPGNWWVGL